VKVKVPSMQDEAGTKIVTCIDWVGFNVPLDGVKVAPVRSLTADQFRLLEAAGAGDRVTVQVQPLS